MIDSDGHDRGSAMADPVRGLRGQGHAIAVTVVLLLLISLAAGAVSIALNFVIGLAVAITVAAFHQLFPGSRFFSLALANFIGIYACIFVFFIETNFALQSTWVVAAGFLLPLAGFLLGALWRRERIRRIVLTPELAPATTLGNVFGWLVPVTLVGAATFAVPPDEPVIAIVAFVGAMAVISAIVFFAAADVAIFLLDTGLLFEDFWQGMARLLKPAFAFFTFYSLTVIVFGVIYSILDRFSSTPHFQVNGTPTELTFPEALYFSLITISTVGYGEMVPLSDTARLLSAVEIMMGVLLLLFGFNALFTYSRERASRRDQNGH